MNIIKNSTEMPFNTGEGINSYGSNTTPRQFDVNMASYARHIRSTLVILFYFMILPLMILILHLFWTLYQKWCDMCTEDHTHNPLNGPYTQTYNLHHECCKAHVAPILSPLAPDFDFKHHCGSRCLGPNVSQNPIFS